MTPTADGTASSLMDILFLVNWNTRVVVLGVTMLGAVGGVVGTFMLLRKRALIGDAVSHATLPGIVIAFFIATFVAGFSGWAAIGAWWAWWLRAAGRSE